MDWRWLHFLLSDWGRTGLIGAGQGELLGDASLDGKWVDGSYQLVDVTIPAGSGFWVQTTGAGTVTFAK